MKRIKRDEKARKELRNYLKFTLIIFLVTLPLGVVTVFIGRYWEGLSWMMATICGLWVVLSLPFVILTVGLGMYHQGHGLPPYME